VKIYLRGGQVVELENWPLESVEQELKIVCQTNEVNQFIVLGPVIVRIGDISALSE